MARVSVGTNGASVSTKQGDSKNSVRTTVSVNKKGRLQQLIQLKQVMFQLD